MSVAPLIINITEPIPIEAMRGFHSAGVCKALVVYDPIQDKHFRVSENTSLGETLVFECDVEGKVQDWGEKAGGRGYTLEEVIKDWANGELLWNDYSSED